LCGSYLKIRPTCLICPILKQTRIPLTITDTDYLASVSTNTFHTLISAEGGAMLPGNTFVASDAVRAERWRIESTPTSVSLVRTFGLIMFLR
jgi:hypothetical protein